MPDNFTFTLFLRCSVFRHEAQVSQEKECYKAYFIKKEVNSL